ncbi:MAG: glutathione synthase [Candidatus Berkiella sp.]
MTTKLCIVMDPIESINIKKDTTFALMLEAQKRQFEIYYLNARDLFLADNQVSGLVTRLRVKDDPHHFYEYLDAKPQAMPLSAFNAVLMRKDPPFDIAYLYATYLLELAQSQGCVILNHPTSIRDANEKLYTAWFADCCPPTLVTSQKSLISEFIAKQLHIVLKPLHSMGGQGILMMKEGDLNLNAAVDLLTHRGKYPIMAQRYIPEILTTGDKRILIVDGQALPFAIARIPGKGDFRGNLASGAKGVAHKLTERDLFLCQRVGPTLKAKGLFLVGIDVIGDYITEINVTSPTCVREIDALFNVNLAETIIDSLTQLMK